MEVGSGEGEGEGEGESASSPHLEALVQRDLVREGVGVKSAESCKPKAKAQEWPSHAIHLTSP